MKQKNLGQFLGGLIDTYGRMSLLISIGSLIMTTGTFYVVVVKPYFQAPWLTLPVAIIMIVLLFAVIMLLTYLFITPAMVAYSNRQWYSHDNPMRRDLEEIKWELMAGREKTNLQDSDIKC